MEAAAAAARSSLPALSHKLMEQFSFAASGGNLVFSPLSIYCALSQIATSARGSTLRELLDVVGVSCSKELAQNASFMVHRSLYGGPQYGGPLVTYGSALWHDTTLTPKPAYRQAAYSLKGGVGAVDFLSKPEEARNHINWVMSSLILPPESVDQDTRLVHTSVVRFLNGKWEMPFYRWRNKEHKFHRLDGSTVDSKFMHSNEDQLVATHDGFKVLKMAFTVNDPYYGVPTWEMGALMRNKSRTLLLPTRYSMCIFLPDAPGGLWSLEKKMASSPGFLHEHLPKKRVRVGEFRVPKFNLSFYTSVKRSLQDLGIESAFSTGADLRDMLEDHGPARQPLFLADILHEVDIEVDEDGTQPAAYTACAMCGACLWPEGRPGCVDFIADHPFAFFVIEEVSGVVLLAGHVLDPTKW